MLLKKLLFIKTLFIIFFLGFFSNVSATDVGGIISTNTGWTLANSPYIVTSDLTLNSGVTLTIEAGVEVKFNLDNAFTVKGTLLANGTSTGQVIFTSNEEVPTVDDWGGIRIEGSGSNGSILDYVQIEYGRGGTINSRQYATVFLYDTQATISNSLIDNVGYTGINIYSDTNNPTLYNNIIKNCSFGLRIFKGSPIIQSNDLLNNIRGIYVDTGSTTPLIENNLFEYNEYGVRINGGTATIQNNNIQNNTGDGIYLSNGTPIITSNIIDGNLNGIYTNNGLGDINLNTIQNNTEYGINSHNLQIWEEGNTTSTNNTFINNGLGEVVSRGMDLNTNSIVDGTQRDIVVIGTDYLDSGKTLTIKAGSIFKVKSTSLNIKGTLLSEGTIDNPIIFTSINDNSVGESLGTGTPSLDWHYLKIEGSGSNSSILDYIEVRHAGEYYQYGAPRAGVYLYDTQAVLKNSLIEDNFYGIRIDTTSNYPTIENNVIINNEYGVYVYKGSATISNNNVLDNNRRGIYLEYTSTTPLIQNNTIKGNIEYGVRINGGTATIQNNNIQNNTLDGIYLSNGTPIITSNIIDGNLNGIYTNNGLGDINLNTIQNNTEYGINSHNLQIWEEGNTTSTNNTFINNGLGEVVSRGMDLNTNSIVDGTQRDIVVIGTDYLDSGKTLTIKAGSIFKVKSTSLNIKGTLLSEGTIDNPIIFTSINDNSVGESLGTGTPSLDWHYLKIEGSGSNSSILDYIEVRHAGEYYQYGAPRAGVYLYDTQAVLKNSLIEDNFYGIRIDTTSNYPTIENNVIINNEYGVYVYKGSATISNNNVLDNNRRGIYLEYTSTTPLIQNNIIKGNLEYGVRINGGTPTIIYNLFFENTLANAYNYTLDSTNIIGKDPMFASEGSYDLDSNSPARNAGNPALGLHPISGNIYDIGAFEYLGYKKLAYTATISGVDGRNLSYKWFFALEPTNGAEIPVINNKEGYIDEDGNISCNFTLFKLGNYAIKLQVKDGLDLVGSAYRTFNISK